jgi:hypothetical protein
MLLGIAVVVAAASAAAAPPEQPLVDCRGPDPIVQRFHSREPATFGYGGGFGDPRRTGSSEWFSLGAEMLGRMLRGKLTMPLGTVPMWY